MARKPKMADVALEIVGREGPLTIPELADALVAAGATKARDPFHTAEALVRDDERLVTDHAGRVSSVLVQLDGAVLSHRVNPFEVAHDLLVLDDADWLIEVATARACRLTTGEALLLTHAYRLFDIPWDEDGRFGPPGRRKAHRSSELDLNDADAVWSYLMDNEYSRVLSGPAGWLGDVQAGDVVALRPSNGDVELLHIDPSEIPPDEVSSAIETVRAIAAGNASTRDVLVSICTEAPLLLRTTLPPLSELLAEALPSPEVEAEDLIPFDPWTDSPSDQYDDHMGTRMTATEVKAKLLSLLDRVAAGEEVEITKHGRSIARLVPAAGPHALRGSLVGVAMTAEPEDDLLSTGDRWNAA
jgi:prevent-host-death family protein